MQIDQRTVIVVREKLRSASLPDEVIVLNEKQGGYFSLSDVGLRIWTLVQQPTTIDTIVEQLTEEFDVDRAQCMSDVLKLISEMAANGLVLPHDGALE